MTDIETRALSAIPTYHTGCDRWQSGYIQGALDQQKMDVEKAQRFVKDSIVFTKSSLVEHDKEVEKKVIEKACEWVSQNIGDYIEYKNGTASFHNGEFQDAFKKAMEE